MVYFVAVGLGLFVDFVFTSVFACMLCEFVVGFAWVCCCLSLCCGSCCFSVVWDWCWWIVCAVVLLWFGGCLRCFGAEYVLLLVCYVCYGVMCCASKSSCESWLLAFGIFAVYLLRDVVWFGLWLIGVLLLRLV